MRPNVSLHAAYLNQLDIYNRITDYASDVPFHPVSLSLPTHHHHEHYPEKNIPILSLHVFGYVLPGNITSACESERVFETSVISYKSLGRDEAWKQSGQAKENKVEREIRSHCKQQVRAQDLLSFYSCVETFFYFFYSS